MKPAIIQLHTPQGRSWVNCVVLHENLLSACYCLWIAQIPLTYFHHVSKNTSLVQYIFKFFFFYLKKNLI